MRPDSAERLKRLAQERHQQTLMRARSALASVPKGEAVTVARLAALAGVSRSWLYGQHDLLDQIEKLKSSGSGPRKTVGDSRASTESNRRRLEIAHLRISELTAENRQLRDSVARLHGQLREEAIRLRG
ncbi:MAG: DUF6262 family protein [Acidiferrobacteraceae bacterium]